MKKLVIKSGDLNLVGNISTSKTINGSYPAIIFVHGWQSNQKKDIEYSKNLLRLGYICMTFDLGGHGESDGDINNISRKDFIQEVVDAYDYLVKQKQVDKNNIHVVGSSFGCYLATILTSKRKVKSLLLRAPQNYPDEDYSQPKVKLQGNRLKKWRLERLDSNATKSLKSLHEFEGKVLIMESEIDKYVPPQTYANYKNAVKNQNLKYLYMKGLHHSIKSDEDKDRYIEVLVRWFKTKI